MKVSTQPDPIISASGALARRCFGTTSCFGSRAATLGWDRGTRKCRAVQGMKKRLLSLSVPNAPSHALCSGDFLRRGWLMVSAGGQSIQKSQAPRAAPCDDISIAAPAFTSITDFLRREAGSTDPWPQGYSSQCLQDIACD